MEDKKIFRCGKCGEVVVGIKALTQAREEGCSNCGSTYFEKNAEEGDNYPLRDTNHIPVSIW